MIRERRWEHGSDQHWVHATSPVAASYPWADRGVLFGTGRHALNGVLEVTGARRLWIPSFYCPDVIAAIPNKQLVIEVYRESPLDLVDDLSGLPVESGDIVLVQNLFGLRLGPPKLPAGAVVLEDHTHDPTSPWATSSRADYCFSSLRKLLPVADGGVAWSPVGRALPSEPLLDPAHANAALDRLTGILLKAAYLVGGAIDKAVYRAHLVAGERALAHGAQTTLLPLTRGCLSGFPIASWRAARNANVRAFADALGRPEGAFLLAPPRGAVAFTATLCFATPELRERVRQALIAAQIYPAVLWPLETASYVVPRDEVALSRRLFSLHCDHRYTAADLERVATEVKLALTSAK